MDKISRKKIKKLKQDKKYGEIFLEFGKEAYINYVPAKYKKEDLKRLKKEKRYEDIYNKYGKDTYNSILVKAMYGEIKEAKGTIKAILWRINMSLKKIGFTSAFSIMQLTAAGSLMTEATIMDNSVKYESEIEQYNNNISKYADEVKSLNLSDIQIFMKVMDDMWRKHTRVCYSRKRYNRFFRTRFSYRRWIWCLQKYGK